MSDSTRTPGRIRWPNVISVLSAAILIGTVIVGTGLATGWAIAGMLGFGEYGQYALEGLFGLVALAVVVVFVRSAARIEPFVER